MHVLPLAASLLLLAVTLAVAVIRPRGLPEAAAAVPAGVAALVLGLVTPADAIAVAHELSPTVAFLAAVLVLAELCRREGLFAAAGGWMASASRGRPRVLLALTVAVASVVTATLSLDATAVLLTPVVLTTAGRQRLGATPHVFACGHLANSASLLLPISNLTNLIAFRATGLSFGRFAALMALPWLVAIGLEWLALRRYFARELAVPGDSDGQTRLPVPRVALAVVCATLAGCAWSSHLGIDPAVPAAAGAAVLAVRALLTGRASGRDVTRAASPLFALFVLGLGLVVRAASIHGLDELVHRLVPDTVSVAMLLGVAVLAAVLANVVNNLPAILVLLPAVAAAGPPAVLAALIGVNIGPNLTYVGSLATLLWRRVLHDRDADPTTREFLVLGLRTVPVTVVGAVGGLWAGLQLLR